MNQRHLLFMLMFAAGLFPVADLNAQKECDLTIASVDYGQALLPNILTGKCKPENTVDIEVIYTDGMSDSLKVNGKTFPTTGSPQTVQVTGIPKELVVELVGTTCYQFEGVDLYHLPSAPVMLEGDTVFCSGETIPRIALLGRPNTTFYWTNKDGSCVQSLFFSGAYNEEWTRPHPGEFAVYQHINGMVTEPLYINIREGMPVEIIGDRYFCEGEYSTLNALVNRQSVNSKYEIRWHTPLGIKYDVKSIKADLDYLYILEVIDDKGCKGSTSVWIEQINAPRLNILTPQHSIQNNDLRVVASGSGCFRGCDYLWETPNGTVQNTQIIDMPNKGKYTITVTGKHGCAISKDIMVE